MVTEESIRDVVTDIKRKIFLSNIQLVINHQREQATHSANITNTKIIKNNVAHVSNPILIVSSIFYVKF